MLALAGALAGTAAHAAQTRAGSDAIPAPPLVDLPHYAGELDSICAELRDAEFAKFADAVGNEGFFRQLGLQGIEWDPVYSTLIAEAVRREVMSELALDLAWKRAALLIERGEFRRAEEVLGGALERAQGNEGRFGWVHVSLAQVAMSLERWDEALELLDLAESYAAGVSNPEDFQPYVDAKRCELWNLIRMPDLARPCAEAQWRANAASEVEYAWWNAFELWVQNLSVANDFAELAALEREVLASEHYAELSGRDSARVRRRFASVLIDRGLQLPAANAEAARRLGALVAEGELEGFELEESLEGLMLAHLQGGELEQAAAVEAELLERLAERGVDVPADVVGASGLLALRRWGGDPERRSELEASRRRLESAWWLFREGWGHAPARDGGVGYLLCGRRQLLVEALLGTYAALLGPEHGAEAGLQWLVQAQLEGTLARQMKLARTPFPQLRAALLPEGRALVAWVPARTMSFALAADAKRALLVPLPASLQLEALARELDAALLEQLHDPSPGHAAALRARLAEAKATFLPPALEQFLGDAEELYLCGLDDLGGVPFELFEAGNGTTQGARRAVARTASLPLVAELDRRARAEAGVADGAAVLLLADVPSAQAAAGYGVQALDVPEELWSGLLRGWGGREVRALRGPAATREALRSALQQGAALAQLIVHGVQRVDERPRGVLLARGALFAEDLEALPMPPVVLLTACGAARSRQRRGDDGRSGLTASLFLAGAESVSASHHDLEVTATLRACARIQEGLRSGLGLAEALRDARRAAPGSALDREALAPHLLHASGAAFRALLPRDE